MFTIPRWYPLTLNCVTIDGGFTVILTTNTPCHLWLYWTEHEPWTHPRATIERGLAVPWHTYWCYVAWHVIEQNEAGDTLTRTFTWLGWENCQTKYFRFHGGIGGILSPSDSPIFHLHYVYAPPEEGEEKQEEYNSAMILYGSLRHIAGQRLHIPNRRITKLSFVLERINYPVGDIFYVIVRPYDNIELFRQYLCDASEIAGGPNWYELALTIPPTIDDEVTIGVEYLAGGGGNHITVYYQNTDIKPIEHLRVKPEFGCWSEKDDFDCAYKYAWQYVGSSAGLYSIEQLCGRQGMFFGDATVKRIGQKLTIPNRRVTTLGFWIWKRGAPTGNITFAIRRVSDDSLICSKVWGDASALQTAAAYEEVSFDTPPVINEEVRAYVEFLNGNYGNRTAILEENYDVKADEGLTYWPDFWNDYYFDSRDCAYRINNYLV